MLAADEADHAGGGGLAALDGAEAGTGDVAQGTTHHGESVHRDSMSRSIGPGEGALERPP